MMCQKPKEHLNKRSEHLCKYRHANKFLFKYYAGNDLAISNSLKKHRLIVYVSKYYLI